MTKQEASKVVCMPSSRLINSLEKVRPGMRPASSTKDGSKRSREEDTLDGGKGDKTFTEGARSSVM